jgi:hypothetical protein
MIFPIQHSSVNWVDGMKISKNHFIDADNHQLDTIRDGISIPLTSYNFGLLPPEKGSTTYFEIYMSEKPGNAVEVRLKQCQAVTLGGCRISVTSDVQENGILLSTVFQGAALQTVSNNEISWFEIVLVVNPYERIPKGNPDLEENPPRHPYSDNRYALQVLPENQLNKSDLGAYHLVIGAIKSRGGQLSPVHQYIPPCTSIESHPALLQHYEKFAGSFQMLHQQSLRIIKKTYEKNKPSTIAKNYKLLCEKMLEYNASIFFQLRNTIPKSPPIFLVGCFSSLANVLYTTLHCIPSEEKEELLKYTFEWCDITPSDLEETLLQVVEIRYNHYQIAESMHLVQQFLTLIQTVWSRMDSLEFIGQRKENMVVTKEDIKQQVEQPKKRWSILD